MNNYEANSIDNLTPSEGLELQLNNEGTGYIVVGKGSCSDTNIVIPSTYSNLPVTEIGKGAFKEDCGNGIISVYIPRGVTVIGDHAFLSCTGLSKITISDSVTKIGAYVFSDCTALVDVTLPRGLKEIDKGAFMGCRSLEKIAIPNGVKRLNCDTFALCAGLREVSIPESVEDIDNFALLCCENLESITVDENNEHYRSIDGNLYSKDGSVLILYGAGKDAEEFRLPIDVTKIGYGAFAGCKNLRSISIPDRVTEIEKEAFSGCEALESVLLPNGITRIASDTFFGCVSLECITIPKSVRYINSGALRANMIIFEDTKNWKVVGGGFFSGISKGLLSNPVKAAEAFSHGKYADASIEKKS